MTVRQVFYRLVSLGAILKTESQYKSIGRLLVDMRRAKELPFEWFVDTTRRMRKGLAFSSMEGALHHTASAYRRALWDNQDVYVEVWLEKDALAGVFFEVTDPWDVPLMVTRGYPSVTFLHEAAQTMTAVRKPVIIFYFGDYDASGDDIPRVVEEGIQEFAPGIDLTFERVAVNPAQITQMNLPTRPPKKRDTHSKKFKGDGDVEVDAIRPADLRSLVSDCIERSINRQALDVMRTIEKSERDSLQILMKALYS